MEQGTQHEKWSSRGGFIFAAVGAAIGLGNIWRFPYIAGQNGGGAFVLLYIALVIFLCLPIIASELALGRMGKQSPLGTMTLLVRRMKARPFWKVIGWLSLLIPFLGSTYYSVVAGWSLEYLSVSLSNGFSQYTSQGSPERFGEFMASPVRMVFWHSLYMLAVGYIVSKGIRSGLEKAVKIIMPALFLILFFLVIYAAVTADFSAALSFLFTPDFSKLNGDIFLMAMGQAFYSVAIGVGAMMVYGAYLPDNISIPRAALIIGAADTFVALLAGLAIFPFIFSYGLEVGEGPGLIFISLPVAFSQMPGGSFIAPLFFFLLSFAAFTTSLGMLEPVVSWLEEHKGFKRGRVTVYATFAAWFIGLGAAFSFNIWKDFTPLSFIDLLEGKTIFDLIDFIVANFMLPLNGLLIAVFAGWVLSRQVVRDELGLSDGLMMSYIRITTKVLAPIAVISIFIYSF